MPAERRTHATRVVAAAILGLVSMVIVLAGFAAIPTAAYATGTGASAPPRVVVIGDSLVAGFGLEPGRDWPSRMQAALTEKGIETQFVNAGVSGDTSTGGLARLDWALAEGASAVIVELGANDALRGIPVGITGQNLEEIVIRLKERSIPVMLMGMRAPPNMGSEYAGRFDAIYQEIAERHDVALYPFFLEGVAAQPELNLDDGMHPNAEGVDEIVRRSLPSVAAFLAPVTGVTPNSESSSAGQ